jgi:hypothetical protein
MNRRTNAALDSRRWRRRDLEAERQLLELLDADQPREPQPPSRRIDDMEPAERTSEELHSEELHR